MPKSAILAFISGPEFQETAFDISKNAAQVAV